MFKRIVDVVEWLVLAAAAVFVVCLFVVGSDDGGGDGGGGEAAGPGAEVFAGSCATCHGSDGGGGIGPPLADGAVVEAFPNEADEVAVITEGRGNMPAFGDQLSADEIQAVTDYTRSL